MFQLPDSAASVIGQLRGERAADAREFSSVDALLAAPPADRRRCDAQIRREPSGVADFVDSASTRSLYWDKY
ncbi:MAG: hypothetical protein ACTH8F_17020 [Microbacterium sp.]|uniref:hypothetical protein n=1 Tax=Microbacterium sp. TaxID=51671 RepID=UPI003F9CF9E7